MAYVDLTQKEKDDLQIVVQAIRGAVSSLFAVRNKMLQIADFSTLQVDPIIATLDNADVIPNVSGLAGAQDITVGEYKAAQAKLRAYMADASDPALKPVLIKLAGINAE